MKRKTNYSFHLQVYICSLAMNTAIYLAWSERFTLSTLEELSAKYARQNYQFFSSSSKNGGPWKKKWLGKSHNSLDLIRAFSGDNHHSWYEEGSTFGPLYTQFYRLLKTYILKHLDLIKLIIFSDSSDIKWNRLFCPYECTLVKNTNDGY